MTYRLGILDQSRLADDDNPQDALQATIRLAEQAEEWGYDRFWVSEHHGKEELAGASPEILMSYLLAKTKTIRIGSGGVMLQHYSPYKVAENFQLIEWIDQDAADGFIFGAPILAPALEELVTYVLPKLEEQGYYSTDYKSRTLRENLGLTELSAVPD